VLTVPRILQIESVLGKQLDSIYEGNASALRVLSVVGAEGFHLRDRALHVYSEAGRVYAFRDVCKVSFGAQLSIYVSASLKKLRLQYCTSEGLKSAGSLQGDGGLRQTAGLCVPGG
jgi:hypothetical protein